MFNKARVWQSTASVAAAGPHLDTAPVLAVTLLTHFIPQLAGTHKRAVEFKETRRRFDDQVPLLDPLVTLRLVLDEAMLSDGKAHVDRIIGQSGFVALARLDRGALFRRSGDPVQATLYLAGNPVIAREILAVEPAAGLYAPFRLVVYRDGWARTSPTTNHQASSRRLVPA